MKKITVEDLMQIVEAEPGAIEAIARSNNLELSKIKQLIEEGNLSEEINNQLLLEWLPQHSS